MKIANVLAVLVFSVFLGIVILPSKGRANDPNRQIVVTTFPIYQIVKNVTQGREGVSVNLMISSQMGCPHDYALTPQDMQKLAKAGVLIVNGLGLEEFLGAPIDMANPKIHIIDSSLGIENILHSEEEHEGENKDGQEASEHHEGQHETAHHDHDEHDHAGPNPHLYVSPVMNGKLAMNIAAELSKIDSSGAALYFQNAQKYSNAMNALAKDMTGLGKRLNNNRIVQPHQVFDYLARDIGLEIIANLSEHGQEPSASEMVQLVKTIKEHKAGAIFTEPQYPEKIGTTLSRETGVPVSMLDPVATGPENAPLDYYEKTMRNNMKTLETVLGVH